jgi:hypothetical protein
MDAINYCARVSELLIENEGSFHGGSGVKKEKGVERGKMRGGSERGGREEGKGEKGELGRGKGEQPTYFETLLPLQSCCAGARTSIT